MPAMTVVAFRGLGLICCERQSPRMENKVYTCCGQIGSFLVQVVECCVSLRHSLMLDFWGPP